LIIYVEFRPAGTRHLDGPANGEAVDRVRYALAPWSTRQAVLDGLTLKRHPVVAEANGDFQLMRMAYRAAIYLPELGRGRKSTPLPITISTDRLVLCPGCRKPMRLSETQTFDCKPCGCTLTTEEALSG
jgi:hypothetical protein